MQYYKTKAPTAGKAAVSFKAERKLFLVKIKIYGDSILKGVMFNEQLNRYKLFGYRFEALNDKGIEVENNCKMGATIEEGFEIMQDTLTDCDSDTVVLLEYGGNDCNFNWKDVSENPNGEFLPNTPAEKFKQIYRKMINYARKKGAKVAVCNLVPIESNKFINWVSKGLSYENIMHWLGDVNRISRWQEYYSHLSEQVARDENCPLLDLRSNFLTHCAMPNMIGIDGMHPSFEGHSLIKDTLQQTILAAR